MEDSSLKGIELQLLFCEAKSDKPFLGQWILTKTWYTYLKK